MKPNEIISLIRACIRPYLTIIFASSIAALALILGLKFADKELALVATGALFGSGSTIMAFWFAGRKNEASPTPQHG